MAQTLTIPPVTIQAGSRTFGPFTSPVSFSGIDLTINFSSFPATADLSILLQVSTDGGVTQRDFGGATGIAPTGMFDMHPRVTGEAIPAGARITVKTEASEVINVSGGSVVVL